MEQVFPPGLNCEKAFLRGIINMKYELCLRIRYCFFFPLMVFVEKLVVGIKFLVFVKFC